MQSCYQNIAIKSGKTNQTWDVTNAVAYGIPYVCE